MGAQMSYLGEIEFRVKRMKKCNRQQPGAARYLPVGEMVPPWIKSSSNTWMNFYLAYLPRYNPITMHFSLNVESDMSCQIQTPIQKKPQVSIRYSKRVYVFMRIVKRPTIVVTFQEKNSLRQNKTNGSKNGCYSLRSKPTNDQQNLVQ